MHSLAFFLGNRALVLKEFKVNLDGEEYVHIVARKAGLISWLLTLLGFDITTNFRVYSNRIECQKGSLSGQINTVIPLRSVSVATCGYMKPFLSLVLGIIFVVIAIVMFILSVTVSEAPINLFAVFSIIAFVLSTVSFIFYFLNKNLLISVVSNSSYSFAFCFKCSVIEGVKMEYRQAQQVIQIINQLIMISQGTK